MKLKILAIGIILMMVGSTFVATAKLKDTTADDAKEMGATPYSMGKTYDSIIKIEASSSYEYGFKTGDLLKKEYQLIDRLVARFTKKIDTSHETIENQINYIGQNYPFFLEELRGLSASTNMKLENLIILQSKIRSLFDGECTVTLATGKATKNNETFLTFNIDSSVDSIRDIFSSTILHRVFSLKCWIARINTMEYRYAFWGIPILYELPFLNEKGLGWGSPGTGLTENESRHIDEGPGISTMLLEKLAMMTCKNVSEVAKLYDNIERASQKGKGWFHQYDGSSSCFCDKEGGILIIEQTHSHIITVFGNSTEITGAPEGILWHTNHHQWLDPDLTGSVYPDESPSSGFRAERARELLETNYGNITLDVCKKITRDHGGGYNEDEKDSGDICRHPDKYSLKVNAFSWIIVPKELTVYWTHTSPCKGIFWKHDFSKIFDV
jgi:hypothetical protein